MVPKDHWGLKASPYSDGPRFWPPGTHPATFKWRVQLAKLMEIEAGGVLSVDGVRMMAYVRDQMAAFEQAESEAKAREFYRIQEYHQRRESG